MKLRSFLVLPLMILLSTLSTAQSHADQSVQDIDRLLQHVLDHTTEHYKTAFQKKKFKENVQINVGRIDSRLQLSACDDNLTLKINEPPHHARNITVKVSCMNKKRWTIYIPVSIDIYANVLVSTRSLQRGDILTQDDLEFKRMNISSIGRGHVEDLSRILGMEMKRPLRPGDVVRLPHLNKPDIVRKGQIVVVSSSSRFLRVETSGIALVNGYLGERIRVKNERSNRVVDVEVVAPGRVSIATR